MASGYRWRAGIWDADDVTDDYDIENWPLQGDMYPGISWLAPRGEANLVVPGGYVDTIDGHKCAEGGYEFEWVFPYLTANMLQYLRKNLFEERYSNEATVLIPDVRMEGGISRFYTCIAQWPAPDRIRGLQTEGGGLVNFPVRFVRAVNISTPRSVDGNTGTLGVTGQTASISTI